MDLLGTLRYDGMDPLADADAPWTHWTVNERRDFLALFLNEVRVRKGLGHSGGNQTKWRGHERLEFVWAVGRRSLLPF